MNLPVFFTARRYASAVYAVILCLSVGLSIRHKPVDDQIGTETTPSNSTETLVF